MSLCLGGSWVFIWQQISDTLADTICRLRQHVTFPGNSRNIIVRKWQPKLGHLIWFCRLWGHRRPPQAAGRIPKCQFLMHNAGRICIVKLHLAMSRNSIYFFTYFLFRMGFFIVFYGYICSSHGTNTSFSVFHWLWQKKWAAAADVLLKHRSCFYADAFSIQEWI